MKTKDVKHLFPCFGATSVLINIITLFVFSLFIKRERKHIYSILSDINIAIFFVCNLHFHILNNAFK